MDIQSLSTSMSQARVQEQASVKVAAMGINAMKEQGAELATIMQSAPSVSDPNLGQKVNIVT